LKTRNIAAIGFVMIFPMFFPLANAFELDELEQFEQLESMELQEAASD